MSSSLPRLRVALQFANFAVAAVRVRKEIDAYGMSVFTGSVQELYREKWGGLKEKAGLFPVFPAFIFFFYSILFSLWLREGEKFFSLFRETERASR